MTELETGQVNTAAADVYEEFFVPALFGQWAERMLDAAGVKEGHRVLDAACGTGVVARAALRRVGAGGSVAGIDINEGMLAVAQRKEPGVEWRLAPVEAIPYDDATFDAVTCQFALMFFDDRPAAVREMLRVLRPGGRVSVATWDSLDTTPGYARMVELLDEMFGPEVAAGLRAPFVLGDVEELRAIFDAAGAGNCEVQTIPGTAVFPSIESWVYTDVRGWTMSDAIDEAGFERLVEAAKRELAQFAKADGTVEFPAPAHIVSVAKD